MEKEKFIAVLKVSGKRRNIGVAHKVETVRIENELDSFYETLGCSLVQVVSIEIHGKWYDLWCDEEGLINNPSPIPMIALGDDIEARYFQIVCGTVFFANTDDEGNAASLSDKDIWILKKWLKKNHTIINQWCLNQLRKKFRIVVVPAT